MHRRTPWWIDVLFLAALGFGIYQAALNRVAIGDWIFFRTYTPSAEITKLADDAGMSEEGRKLFYRTDPKLVSKEELVQLCDLENLGCITEDGHIFILRTTEDREYGQAVITAAHEMLHMAYRRTPKEELETLRELLQTEISRLGSQPLDEQLGATADEAEFYDEAHSILGTEYPRLLDDAEKHYERYFSDRNRVLAW